MILPAIILCFSLLSCNAQNTKTKIGTKQQTTKKVTNIFEGNFAGMHNEKEIFVSLIAVPRTNKLTGTLTMNGQEAKITATSNNNYCNGKIVEDDTQKAYNITAEIINNQLHFNITFPEYNNQVLALVLDRSTLVLNGNGNQSSISSNSSTIITSGTNSGSSSKPTNRDRALVGKWRFTEVISSGSGQFYSTFSTDYFVQFNVNGSCLTWTGKSAGGSGNVSFDSNDGNNVESARWYTEGKNVVFVNPNNNNKMSVPYYAEQNRMILKGKLNRVYTRIN